MSLEERVGDLFAAVDVDAIAHGCNCAGAMGAGIAVEFKRRWPAMFEEYRRRCADGTFGLGDVFAWPGDGLVVYNLGTQRTWRTKATVDAIATAVGGMLRDAEDRGVAAIGLPRIGAGLGGLQWPVVRERLAEVSSESAVRLSVYALPSAAES